MPILTLFRHAKSSWDDPELDDFDRPLSERGRKAAPAMAAYLAQHELTPDYVLCSASCRTRQTLDLALPHWRETPEINYSHAIYDASETMLLSAIRHVPPATRNLMIVGHNPGLETLALKMRGNGEARQWSAMANKFPTAAIAVIRIETSNWAKVQFGTGHLELFATPKLIGAENNAS